MANAEEEEEEVRSLTESSGLFVDSIDAAEPDTSGPRFVLVVAVAAFRFAFVLGSNEAEAEAAPPVAIVDRALGANAEDAVSVVVVLFLAICGVAVAAAAISDVDAALSLDVILPSRIGEGDVVVVVVSTAAVVCVDPDSVALTDDDVDTVAASVRTGVLLSNRNGVAHRVGIGLYNELPCFAEVKSGFEPRTCCEESSTTSFK